MEDGKKSNFPTNFESHHLLRIQWWKSDTEILRSVRAWLKINSPPGRKQYTSEGRATFERRVRAALKALAAYRLLRANKGDWTLPPSLYVNQSEWIEAQTTAEIIIHHMSHVLP